MNYKYLFLPIIMPVISIFSMEMPLEKPSFSGTPSLKFLSAHKIGSLFKKSVIEKSPLPQDLKKYTLLLEQFGDTKPGDATHDILKAALFEDQLTEELLQDLYTLDPELDLNMPMGYCTPLQLAMERKNIAQIKFLLDHGAQINVKHHFGLNSSALLMDINLTDDDLPFLQFLLEQGITLNERDARPNSDNNTLLMALTCRENNTLIIKTLLDHLTTEKINAQNGYGNTALMLAVYNENIPAVQLLLEKGADTELMNDYRHTAFIFAYQKRNQEIMKLLKEHGANINYRQHNGYTALCAAASNTKNSIVNFLLELGANTEIGNNQGETPLKIAIKCNNQEATKLLLEHGANIHAPSGSLNQTPLFCALASGQFNLASECLLYAGPTIPNRHPSEYYSGLSQLIKSDDPINQKILHLLLEKGLNDSLENCIAYKNSLIDDATPEMRLILKNYRPESYHQSSWYQQRLFELNQFLTDHPKVVTFTAIGAGVLATTAATYKAYTTYKKITRK